MLGKMKIYTVHVQPEISRGGEKPIFVREGFNIYAFLFTALWALSQRLWLHAIAIVLTFMFLISLGTHHVISSTSVGVLQLVMQVIIGFHANDWQRAALRKQGYVTSDVTAGENLLRAEQRYFDRYVQTVSS